MKHLIDVMTAARRQIDANIGKHLGSGVHAPQRWIELVTNQHYLSRFFAREIFSIAGHDDFFHRPMLRRFLLQLAESLEIDARIATDDLKLMRCNLQPPALEAELYISHFQAQGIIRPFALIGALCVFTQLTCGTQLRHLLSIPTSAGSASARSFDRLCIGAQKSLPLLLEEIGISLPTRNHHLDLAEGASAARLFSLRMLDQATGRDYADLVLPHPGVSASVAHMSIDRSMSAR